MMMKNLVFRKLFVFSIIITMFFAVNSCKGDSSSLLPRITGTAGEVVLVMSKAQWEGRIGEKYREILGSYIEIFPQPEPMFTLIHIPDDAFTNIFRSHRNIIVTRVSSEVEEAKVLQNQDMWAAPQLVFNVVAQNESDLLDLLETNSDRLVNLLLQKERNRIMDAYRANLDQEIRRILRENHQLTLNVPAGYHLDLDSSDFVWISLETAKHIQGIFVYHFTYNDENAFSKDFLVNKRNQMLKKYVPGGDPGSYMTTETIVSPEYREFTYRERLFSELRGLWKLERGFMGGPFVSIATLDENRNRIIVAEGFVFAPNQNKRNFLRQVEAIIFSLNIVDE